MEKTRSVDGLLNNVEAQLIDSMAGNIHKEQSKIDFIEENKPVNEPIEQEEVAEQDVAELLTDEKAETEKQIESEVKQDSNIDEYGNAIAKAKTYTEEEVQRMIRERLSRGNQSQQQQQNTKEAVQDFQYDENNEQPWQQQLESHIEHTVQRMQQKHSQKEWEATQQSIQSDFEAKFTSGMGKYSDFQDVVSKAPITDTMMMATRSMNNPAAFIYAASKNHGEELARISKIPDPFAQAKEIGNLEAKMIKAKKITSATRPVNTPSGDIPGKPTPKRNIDSLIQKDAERNLRSRR
jgi:hypothetical protein